MNRPLYYAALLLVLVACVNHHPGALREGNWLGMLQVKEGLDLPFAMTVELRDTSYLIKVFNAGEEVNIDEIAFKADSVYIRMPVFEGYIAATYHDTLMVGSFVKESLGRIVPFRARFGKSSRFPQGDPPSADVSGVWEVLFSREQGGEYPAKGIFTQEDGHVRGTFRTTTGDYRYLEGRVSGDTLKLSTFDGAHAFLFVAGVNDSLMNGVFYSGNHSAERFKGRRNLNYELPDANSLTYLKEGYDRFEFRFPDSDGNQVSLEDERYKDEVVVVQIMGTWCPNCLDETRFLVEYLERHPSEAPKVVALAFEYAKTPDKAFASIERLRQREGVPYPILLAQYASSNKTLANEKLPMLNTVLSYPTTIFIDKTGQVRNIYTGFNGPATGDKYEEFKTEFDSLVRLLHSE